jgi:outer membrane protein OmpA-like peptidoglycan-associated protein
MALIAGCATSAGERPSALAQARQKLSVAQTDPHVARFASRELNEAGRAFDQAERMWQEGSASEIIAHHAYLAEQQARIALETAKARAARAEIEQASLERAQVLAQARRADAEAQRRQAEAARQAAVAERMKATEQLNEARVAQQRAAAARAQAEKEVQRLEAEVRELKAEHTDRGWVLTLGSDFLFDVGRATLKPGSRHSIERVAGFLRNHPERRVVVEGFTDSSGSETTNLELSHDRAKAVARALVNADVDASRIDTRGFGESLPVASNDSVAGRQLNRRAEIVVQDGKQAATGRSAGG